MKSGYGPVKRVLRVKAGRLAGLAPFCPSGARVLILGSMPSEESLQRCEYYGNPKNQFWKLLAGAFHDAVPKSYSEKKIFLAFYGIALWDVIASCTRRGSLDTAIRQALENDIPGFLKKNPKIQMIFLNGGLAEKHYKKIQGLSSKIPWKTLPSSSSANALWRPKLKAWRRNLRPYGNTD